jgi:hypothetical protein
MSDNKTDAGSELPEDLAELEGKAANDDAPELKMSQTQRVKSLIRSTSCVRRMLT